MLSFIGASLSALISRGFPDKMLASGTSGTQASSAPAALQPNDKVIALLNDLLKHVENAPKTELGLRMIIMKLETSRRLSKTDQDFLMELSRRVNNPKLSEWLARIAQAY